ncbi:MAG: hypothetical protein ABW022_26470 [Actinoplanes sp.]
MTAAILTPQHDGCLFEQDGLVRRFASYAAAEAEAVARRLPFTVDRFPMSPIVLAESPALKP